MTGPPQPGSAGAGSRWLVVVVALGVIVPGTIVWAWETDHTAGPGTPSTIITLAPPWFGDIQCTLGGSIYFENFFTISAISGPVLTSQFSLSILKLDNQTIPPNGTAPSPTINLPCGVPTPAGWYAILSNRSAGAVATYPSSSSGMGPGGWSNASVAPLKLAVADEFVLITEADLTGSGDRLVSAGLGSSNVGLAGNTTFPAYVRP